MNNNDLKKAYLQSYIPSINAAKRIEEEIEQLRLDKMMPSVIMDDMPHAHNKTDLSDYMAKLDELINKLIAARYKRIDLYAEIFMTNVRAIPSKSTGHQCLTLTV